LPVQSDLLGPLATESCSELVAQAHQLGQIPYSDRGYSYQPDSVYQRLNNLIMNANARHCDSGQLSFDASGNLVEKPWAQLVNAAQSSAAAIADALPGEWTAQGVIFAVVGLLVLVLVLRKMKR
jgi:hypothetical protein